MSWNLKDTQDLAGHIGEAIPVGEAEQKGRVRRAQ